MKVCSMCRVPKSSADFYNARESRCIPCTKAARKVHYRVDIEASRARSREQSARDPNAAERKRRWAAANREKTAASAAAYQARNPEKQREWTRRRRARLRNAAVEKVNYSAIRTRDGDVCYLCASPVAEGEIDFDHVIPLARGGAHAEANVRVTHRRCNRSKGAKTPDEYLNRKEQVRMSTTETETELERTAREEQQAHDEAKPDDGNALFDAKPFEREELALPMVDGNGIDRIAVKFSGEVMLDRSDPEDVALYRRLAYGKDVELRISGKVVGSGARGATNRDGDLDVTIGTRQIKVGTVYVLDPEEL